MENYIVRIYRRGEDRKQEMAGTVEEVGVGRQNVFHTSHELIEMLSEKPEARNDDPRRPSPARDRQIPVKADLKR